jgi:hypothetical protein
MTTDMHLHEDDLVLHYYGELDVVSAGRSERHLAECDDCRASFTRLQRVMAAVDMMPEPTLPDSFERTVWARLEPQLSLDVARGRPLDLARGRARRRGGLSWFVLSPANLAWAAAIVVLVAAAFFAGRVTKPEPAQTIASADQLRERVLMADVGEHLERSQAMLVDLVTADPSDIDMTAERRRAEELVAANRLYRQTAAASGEARIRELLDELERLLVELAASPDQMSADDMDNVRDRIDATGLLFKVRVMSSTLRERQKDEIRARANTRSS